MIAEPLKNKIEKEDIGIGYVFRSEDVASAVAWLKRDVERAYPLEKNILWLIIDEAFKDVTEGKK
jgi:hypothetical protein